MPVDAALLTVHVLAVLTMLASLATDWIGVLRLRHATTLAQARRGVAILEMSAAFGVWGRLAVLATGLWLAIDAWHWQGWIIAGLLGWTALVALGEPLTGKDLRKMAKAARKADDDVTPKLAAKIYHPRLWSSVLTRTGVGAAVLAVMLAKPGLIPALALLLGGYAVGALTARLTAAHQTLPTAPGSPLDP
ncbi:hypothetical protein [Streptomyces cylindrosporus]|uniref:DUF2269 family protein n=1 Tax=Streptomyces cylindrosporus TaxID=2927583 RepID=A0ABS9YLK9_9ACTN|nr:hypothetical protein [Streptomyces cylindrosporus]MCI3277799.1 hypothetical protein [Streptomyces cylindrosporus]